MSTDLTPYHLGDDDTKREVKRMFSVRYNYLHGLHKDELDIYKEAHINPNKGSILNDLINSDLGLSTIDINGLGSEKWINDIVNLVYVLNKNKNEDEEDDKDDRIDLIINVLNRWIHGYRYISIAEDVKKPIEEIVKTILWLQGDFLLSSKTIIRYICLRYDIDNESLEDWSTMVEKGIDSPFEILMLKIGLSDRIAMHYIADWLVDEHYEIDEREEMREVLHDNMDEIISRMTYNGLPRLTVRRVREVLE